MQALTSEEAALLLDLVNQCLQSGVYWLKHILAPAACKLRLLTSLSFCPTVLLINHHLLCQKQHMTAWNRENMSLDKATLSVCNNSCQSLMISRFLRWRHLGVDCEAQNWFESPPATPPSSFTSHFHHILVSWRLLFWIRCKHVKVWLSSECRFTIKTDLLFPGVITSWEYITLFLKNLGFLAVNEVWTQNQNTENNPKMKCVLLSWPHPFILSFFFIQNNLCTHQEH